MNENTFRQLPSVHEVLASSELQQLSALHAHDRIVTAVRAELEELRQQLRQGINVDGQRAIESIASRVCHRLAHESQPKLRTVINATGIVLHTNLGRAPIAEEAAQAAREAARSYLNLELDLPSGKRSSRQLAVREWICRLTGAESATVVNNNAAATIIVLRAVAAGKEVLISRGQLIEIGGSFRIPEIIAVSGAILREVGTTNITRVSDYETAVGPQTGALLHVHSSNYRIRGFTESVRLSELSVLGKKHGLPVIDDIGSGALLDFARFGFEGEPMARASIAFGADLVLFSGDKLLGGPQAGIIAGRKEWVQKIEKDPFMRAVRLDKMTLAALEATLRLYLDEAIALRDVPVLRMLGTPLAELRRRAEKLAENLRRLTGLRAVNVTEERSFVGGGSLPDQAMPSWVIELELDSMPEEDFVRRLRLGTPAVVARLRGGKVLLDVRTVFEYQEPLILEALLKAVSTS
jgi:L-seryl-tRNA(Ser) seleniumtransferase